eukprot:COSAG05_NODE_3298_length_2167_cov_2.754836_2_plen_155_part_00
MRIVLYRAGSNAKALWANAQPMNAEELLTKQAEMVLAAEGIPTAKGMECKLRRQAEHSLRGDWARNRGLRPRVPKSACRMGLPSREGESDHKAVMMTAQRYICNEFSYIFSRGGYNTVLEFIVNCLSGLNPFKWGCFHSPQSNFNGSVAILYQH